MHAIISIIRRPLTLTGDGSVVAGCTAILGEARRQASQGQWTVLYLPRLEAWAACPPPAAPVDTPSPLNSCGEGVGHDGGDNSGSDGGGGGGGAGRGGQVTDAWAVAEELLRSWPNGCAVCLVATTHVPLTLLTPSLAAHFGVNVHLAGGTAAGVDGFSDQSAARRAWGGHGASHVVWIPSDIRFPASLALKRASGGLVAEPMDVVGGTDMHAAARALDTATGQCGDASAARAMDAMTADQNSAACLEPTSAGASSSAPPAAVGPSTTGERDMRIHVLSRPQVQDTRRSARSVLSQSLSCLYLIQGCSDDPLEVRVRGESHANTHYSSKVQTLIIGVAGTPLPMSAVLGSSSAKVIRTGGYHYDDGIHGMKRKHADCQLSEVSAQISPL